MDPPVWWPKTLNTIVNNIMRFAREVFVHAHSDSYEYYVSWPAGHSVNEKPKSGGRQRRGDCGPRMVRAKRKQGQLTSWILVRCVEAYCSFLVHGVIFWKRRDFGYKYSPSAWVLAANKCKGMIKVNIYWLDVDQLTYTMLNYHKSFVMERQCLSKGVNWTRRSSRAIQMYATHEQSAGDLLSSNR